MISEGTRASRRMRGGHSPFEAIHTIASLVRPQPSRHAGAEEPRVRVYLYTRACLPSPRGLLCGSRAISERQLSALPGVLPVDFNNIF